MKKLRDCTEEEVKEYCVKKCCGACPLSDGICLRYVFENDKTMLSDKALDIELPIENKILTNEEKAFLTKVVMLYKEMHCEITKIRKNASPCNNKHYYIWFGYFNKIVRDNEFICLPTFTNANIYKGMKVGETYTLEQLGIVIEEKHKMTIDEFFKSNEKLAIYCDTEEKAKELCKAFDKKGYKWLDGRKYADWNGYFYYDSETYYGNDHTYDAIGCYKRLNYNILEFEDIDLK